MRKKRGNIWGNKIEKEGIIKIFLNIDGCYEGLLTTISSNLTVYTSP